MVFKKELLPYATEVYTIKSVSIITNQSHRRESVKSVVEQYLERLRLLIKRLTSPVVEVVDKQMRSKYEVKAQKELEEKGYRVDNKAGMSRWSKNRDFWNLFDLVAIKRGEPMRWISIKGETGGYMENRKAITEFWLPEGNTKEQWRMPKRKKREWIKWIAN